MSAPLDRNLRKLLGRAYVPALPRAEFRAEVKHAVLARLPDPARRAPPGGTAMRRPTLQRRFVQLAAAAAVLVAALLFAAGGADRFHRWFGGDLAPDAILARGEVALLRPDGTWRAAAGDSSIVGAGGVVEFVTPAARMYAIESVSPGRLTAAERTRVRATAAEDTVAAWLHDGSVAVARPLGVASSSGGDAWRVRTSEGTVAVGEGAVTVTLEMHDAARRARIVVTHGTAWLELDGGTVALAPGTTTFLDDGAPEPDPRATQTGSDGSGGGPAADAADREPAAAEGGAPAEAPAQVTGRVVDGRTGRPVARFEVVVLTLYLEQASGASPMPAYGVAPRRLAVDDDTGTFALRDLGPATYQVFVDAPGFALWRSARLRLGADTARVKLDASLDPGATIAGQVFDPAGAPVVNALVFSETDTPAVVVPMQIAAMERFPGGAPLRPARTDAQGRFELTRLSAGMQRLRACAAGFAPGWTAVESVVPNERRDGVVVRLGEPGRVAGIVTGGGGEPAERRLVIAIGMQQATEPFPQSMGMGVSGADGRYEIGELPPGTYIVIHTGPVGGPGAPDEQMVRTAAVVARETATVDFLGRAAAEPGAPSVVLRGTLYGRDGAPLPQTMLSLMRADLGEEAAREHWIGATTDESGRFAFDAVPPGAYELYLIEGAGKRVTRIAAIELPEGLPAGAAIERDVRLLPATIAGRTVDERTGEPLPDTVLVLFATAPGEEPRFVGKDVADERGAFEFAGVPGGVYRVDAHAITGAHGVGRAAFVQVTEGQPALDVVVRLPAGGSALVTVVDAAGAPVAGARVEASAGDVAWEREWDPSTDGRGAYRLDGLNEGTWTVHAAKEGFVAAAVQVVVRAGAESAVTVVLERAP